METTPGISVLVDNSFVSDPIWVCDNYVKIRSLEIRGVATVI